MKERAPRVLLVEQTVHHGGIANHMLALATSLQGIGWQAGVASRFVEEEEEEIRKALMAGDIPYFRVPFPEHRFSFGLRDVRAAMHRYQVLRDVARTFKPDLVHIHWYTVSPYIRAVLLPHNRPSVTTHHSEHLPTFYEDDAPLTQKVLRSLCYWGEYTFAVSEAVADFLSHRVGLPAERIRRVRTGVDASHFRPPTTEEKRVARRSFGLSEDDRVVCIVGRLVAEKGLDVLMEIVRRLRHRNFLTKVLVAGDGYLKDRLTWHVYELGCEEYILLLGHIDSRQVFWASDVHILPSRFESFAISVIEAMHCGVVPIRTDTGGAREQMDDGVEGFIVAVNDAEAFVEHILDLFNDERKRHMMAKAATRRARAQYTLETMMADILKTYGDALHTSSGQNE